MEQVRQQLSGVRDEAKKDWQLVTEESALLSEKLGEKAKVNADNIVKAHEQLQAISTSTSARIEKLTVCGSAARADGLGGGLAITGGGGGAAGPGPCMRHPPPPPRVLTDSWGGVASGPVVVAPPPPCWRCRLAFLYPLQPCANPKHLSKDGWLYIRMFLQFFAVSPVVCCGPRFCFNDVHLCQPPPPPPPLVSVAK